MANKTKAIETFSFSNWTIEVHRRAARRTVSIFLRPHKPIKVVANYSTPHRAIREFLLQKKDWIDKNLEHFAKTIPEVPKRKIQVAQRFPFYGQELALNLVVTVLPKPFVAVQENQLRVHIPHREWNPRMLQEEHPHLLELLRGFYKREAVQRITERVEFWSEQMSLYPQQLKFREQRTRWGSCTSRGTISLNWRLAVFRPEVIDYVIIHELSHLQHMNHSPLFWSLVSAYCSNYQEINKELRESQHLCEFLTSQR